MNEVIKESTHVKQANLTPTIEVQRATVCEAGSESADSTQMLWAQIVGASLAKAPFDDAFCGKSFLDFLVSLAPQDEIEGRICLRLLALHDDYMNNTGCCTNPELASSGIDREINRDNKFMHSFTVFLGALNKYRYKAKQLKEES